MNHLGSLMNMQIPQACSHYHKGVLGVLGGASEFPFLMSSLCPIFMYHHSAGLPIRAHSIGAPRAEGQYAGPPVTHSQLQRVHRNPGQKILPIGSSQTSLNLTVTRAITLLPIFPPPEQRSEALGVSPRAAACCKAPLVEWPVHPSFPRTDLLSFPGTLYLLTPRVLSQDPAVLVLKLSISSPWSSCKPHG